MKPTKSQASAIFSKHQDTLVVAGPGSGKTTTVIERIKWLIDEHAKPDQIVAITFTNAAAEEMRKRLGDVKLAFIGTLHAYMMRVLRDNVEHTVFGYGDINVVDEELAEKLLQKTIHTLGYRGTREKLREAMTEDPYQAKAKEARLTDEERVVVHYFDQLVAGNMTDLDGILHHGIALLRKGVPLKGVKDIGHLFVDEFQDSTTLDAEIYNLHPAIYKYFVGDPDQGIYGFRGASVDHILTHQADGTVYMEQNFRCPQDVCDAANALIKHNTQRLDKETVSEVGEPGTIQVNAVTGEPEEIHGIANCIKESGLDDSKHAVLLRTNNLVERYAQGLRDLGIEVAEKESPDRGPKDWSVCRMLVSLLCDPDNDTMCYFYLSETEGEQQAMRMSIDAGQNMKTLNEIALQLPTDIEPKAIPAELNKRGISSESVSLYMKIAGELPDDASLGDVAVALSGNWRTTSEWGEGVVVTTMHSAKGREWPVVFIPAMEQGVIPAGRDVEEERRLAYVAITRSKEVCVISHAGTKSRTRNRLSSSRKPGYEHSSHRQGHSWSRRVRLRPPSPDHARRLGERRRRGVLLRRPTGRKAPLERAANATPLEEGGTERIHDH